MPVLLFPLSLVDPYLALAAKRSFLQKPFYRERPMDARLIRENTSPAPAAGRSVKTANRKTNYKISTLFIRVLILQFRHILSYICLQNGNRIKTMKKERKAAPMGHIKPVPAGVPGIN